MPAQQPSTPNNAPNKQAQTSGSHGLARHWTYRVWDEVVLEPLHEIPNVRVRSEAPAKQPMLLVSDLGKGLSFVGKHQGREYGVRAAGRLLRSEPGSIVLLTNDQDSASVWPRPALARWSGLYRIQDRRAHGADCASSQERPKGEIGPSMPRLGPILSAMRGMEPNDSASPFPLEGGLV